MLPVAQALGPKFREAGYRRALDKEPDGGSDGMYFVDISGGSQGRPFWGDGGTIRSLDVVVLVRYFRSADRRGTHRVASEDMRRIGDVCSDPANFDPQLTGIRSVSFLGASRALALPTSELWEARFQIEWQRTGGN